jgi:hypothetical protein
MKGKIKIGATISSLTERQLEALAGSHHCSQAGLMWQRKL